MKWKFKKHPAVFHQMLDKVCHKVLKKTETREADSSKFPIMKHKKFDEFGFYFEMFSLLF